jgi:hypothetical protein
MPGLSHHSIYFSGDYRREFKVCITSAIALSFDLIIPGAVGVALSLFHLLLALRVKSPAIRAFWPSYPKKIA